MKRAYTVLLGVFLMTPVLSGCGDDEKKTFDPPAEAQGHNPNITEKPTQEEIDRLKQITQPQQ